MVLAPRADHHLLSRLDIGLIVFEIAVLGAMILYGLVSFSTSRHAVGVLATQFAWSFWGGVMVLGLLLPLVLEGRALSRPDAPHPATVAAACLVLLGGFLLRYVIV